MVSARFLFGADAGISGRILRLAALTALIFVISSASAPAQGPPEMPLSDAGIIMRILRGQEVEITGSLREGGEARIIASLYYQGRCAALVTAREESPVEAARRAARLLNERLGGEEAPEIMEEGRISFDILLASRNETLVANEAIGAKLNIGVEGLLISSGGREHYIPPLMIMRHATAPNFMESLFRELEGDAPSFDDGRLNVSVITTLAFAEKAPRGEAAMLSSGTIPVGTADRAMAFRSLLQGTRWLMVSQEDDGSFLQRYDPLGARIIPTDDMAADLLISETLLKLYIIVGDRDLRNAAGRSIARAVENIRDMGGAVPSSYVRHGQEDELPVTAALLLALTTRASATGEIEDNERLANLGNFILEMIGRDGGVHVSLRGKVAGEAAQTATAGVAEDAAVALISLYELSRDENRREWLRGARRIIDGQLAAAGDDAPHPKLVIALARLYAATEEERYAERSVELAGRLAGNFYAEGENVPGAYIGGYIREAGPLTHHTALALHALSVALDVSRVAGIEHDVDQRIFDNAAGFVISQQYGPSNSFYLSRPDVVEGAFRAGVRDPLVRAVVTRDVVETLLSAVTNLPEER